MKLTKHGRVFNRLFIRIMVMEHSLLRLSINLLDHCE
uniref:Uncharacterized protein n=1 Tax=Schistosoma curassoni TaxID=6186 RepID=A0A183JDJ2_9TREM